MTKWPFGYRGLFLSGWDSPIFTKITEGVAKMVYYWTMIFLTLKMYTGKYKANLVGVHVNTHGNLIFSVNQLISNLLAQ